MRGPSTLLKIFVALSLLVFVSTSSCAAGSSVNKLESIVAQSKASEMIQSGILVVAVAGQIRFVQSYGYADQEKATPITLNSLFPLGSISKQITASLVLKLAQDHKINLQAPITHYLENVPKAWQKVTVHQLLTHTSGIKECYEQLGATFTDPNACLHAVENQPLSFTPGSQFEYNNTGYFLLTKIVERVSRQSYSAYLSQVIQKPFHLEDIISPNAKGDYALTKKQTTHLVKHYLIERGPSIIQIKSEYLPTLGFASQLTGAGELLGSANAVVTWSNILFNSTYLTAKSLEKMQTKYVYDAEKLRWYGYGLCIRESELGPVYFHAGKIARNGTVFTAYLPSHKLNLVIMSNFFETEYNPLPLFNFGVELAVSLAKALPL